MNTNGQDQNRQKDSQGKGFDLQAFLNPRSKLSSISTFLHVLWRKKWAIVVVWLIIALPVGVFLTFYDVPKNYASQAYLRFPRVVGVGENMARDVSINERESIIRLFLSYSVLVRTIQSMNLQFRLEENHVFRHQVIDSVSTDAQLQPGRYRFRFRGDNQIRVDYSPGRGRSYVIYEGEMADGSVRIPGASIRWKDSFLANADGIKLEMVQQPLQETVERMAKRLKVASLDNGRVNVNYAIQLEDRDPFLVAKILNHLTENFIQVYNGTTEVQDAGVLSQMEKNLEIAHQKLKQSQDRLAEFYKQNPFLLSSPEENPYALVNAQNRRSEAVARREALRQTLASKPASRASAQDHYYWTQEMLNMLVGQGAPRAAALRAKLSELEAKRRQMTETLSPTHPMRNEVDKEVAAMASQVVALAEATQERYAREIEQSEREVAENLPRRSMNVAAELELKRLMDDNANAAKVVDNLQLAFDRAKLGTGTELFKVNVVDEARNPPYEEPSLGRRIQYASLAMVLAFFPGLLWFAFRQAVFPKIWNRDDAERKLGHKVLGTVFYMDDGESKGGPGKRLLYLGDTYRLLDVEVYRFLRAEIENHFEGLAGHGKQAIMVTSSQPGEGKSLTSANLALAFAKKGRKTLLVDADFRVGRLDEVFGLGRPKGLLEILNEAQDSQSLQRLVQESVLATPLANLSLMPRGLQDEDAGELVTRAQMGAFLRLARAAYDVVVVDTPPVLVTADALNIIGSIPSVMFVIRSGMTGAGDAEDALKQIEDRGASIGLLVNGIKPSPADGNRYARYGYYYLAASPRNAKESRKDGTFG